MTRESSMYGKPDRASRFCLIAAIAIAVCPALVQGCRRTPRELVADSGNVIVAAPTAGSVVSSPVTVRGRARVFEAALNGRIVTKSGNVLGEAYFMADAGGPEFGNFDAEIAFKMSRSAESGYVEVFARSAKDGAIIDLVRVPVRLRGR